MGALDADTRVEPTGEGRYRAVLSPDWEIWGPMGGYVAACALRAAGMGTDHTIPAAFSCHYLGVAKFEAIDLVVTRRRSGRVASSSLVEVTQAGRPILDAMVWGVREVEGLEHDETVAPDVPRPSELPSMDELRPDEGPSFPFWNNLDAKPIDFESEWPPDGPRPACWRAWLRFLPSVKWEDPWLDAARSVILVDLPSWPSAHRPHAWRNPPYTAPTLDLHVAFHRPAAGEEWLLCQGLAPLSTRGLFGWNAGIWSESGGLLASGGGQCLYRRLEIAP